MSGDAPGRAYLFLRPNRGRKMAARTSAMKIVKMTVPTGSIMIYLQIMQIVRLIFTGL